MVDRLKLYPWQQADVDKIVALTSPEVGALVVSSPGAGKTLVAVEAQKALAPEVTLIVAPPSTHASWEKTLKRQGVTNEVRPLIGTKRGLAAFADLRWGVPGTYITSAQWFARQDWGGIEPDMVVFDEIHMVSKYGNVGQKKLLGHGKKAGLKARIRIGLSGTPFRNNFENAWSIVRWIEPAAMPLSYWVWRPLECAGVYDHFAPQNLRVTGEREPGKVASRMTCLIAHYQREQCCEFHPNGFLGHLAPPVHLIRTLEMTKGQREFYRSMEDNLVAMLTAPDESGKIPVIAEVPIAARTFMRFCALGLPSYDQETEKLYFERECESPKLDALIEDVKALDGGRVLVFTHSKQFADVTALRLADAGISAAAWTGDTSKVRRKELLANFQSDELTVIVGVISAMGTGTDGLQEAAYNIAWLSVDDDASNDTQGIGRLDRLGQEHQVVMVEYRMRNTYDEGHLPRQVMAQLQLAKSLKAGAK